MLTGTALSVVLLHLTCCLLSHRKTIIHSQVEGATLDDLLKDVRTIVLRAELKSTRRILLYVSVESRCWEMQCSPAFTASSINPFGMMVERSKQEGFSQLRSSVADLGEVMLLVDQGLYIGTVADLSDSQALSDAAVTHVLSVDSVDPTPLLPPGGKICNKWINVLDEATSDLLTYMDSCFLFIREAVEMGGAALVHCQAGRSRSATIIAAYLMRNYQLSFPEAYRRLTAMKEDIQVNSGFEEQLCLYEAMQCQVDIWSPLYKQYRLTKIAEKYPADLNCVPSELFAVDPAQSTSSDVSYRCRKCRRTLFCASNILSHLVGNGALSFAHKKSSNLTGDTVCTSYFIEPVQWMEQAMLGVMDGQLLCPKCRSKLGSFRWYGDQCSCGRWVTPAFQLHRNRVDEIRQLDRKITHVQADAQGNSAL